jgi:hypothetical protein
LYAHIGDDASIWGAVLEKAWAKVKGSYESSYWGGLMTNGIRALVGSPVFTYYLDDEEAEENAEAFWNGIKAADDLGWLMGVYTWGWKMYNENSLQNDHYYHLISAFSLRDRTREATDEEK